MFVLVAVPLHPPPQVADPVAALGAGVDVLASCRAMHGVGDIDAEEFRLAKALLLR